VIRTFASIRRLLDEATLPAPARELAQRMFHRLAVAEAAVHGRDVEQVTFHEVGAVDSVVDIAGTALAITMLGVDRSFASPVPTGMGMMRSEHGAMPIPAPAVVELLRGAPLFSKGVPVELTTPTGAAILATVAEGYGELPPMHIEAVGYGAGERSLEFPNVLRVLIGEAADGKVESAPDADRASHEVVLETNVDDLNPELYAYVLERLFDEGAQDAWLTPILMKKGRPAVAVSVLCSAQQQDAMREVLYRETGTLGVRASLVAKRMLERTVLDVATSWGSIRVKVGFLDGRAVTISPEYEDCARAARASGVAVRKIYEEAGREARAQLDPP
jgi:uncharacterized protein (TIGR00299 family) protein